MQIIQREENLHETCFQKILSESMTRIAIEEIPETLPHGLLDEAIMVASGTRDGEDIQGFSHMEIARMRWIALVQMFIDVKLLLICFFTRVHFQSYMLMCSDLVSLAMASTGEDWC